MRPKLSSPGMLRIARDYTFATPGSLGELVYNDRETEPVPCCVEYKYKLKAVERPNKPRVKICCIGSVEEAWMAIDHGASAIGLVSEMPSGPGVISEDLIASIASTVPPSVSTFLLTCSQDADAIIAQQRRTGTNTIQICDRLEFGAYQHVRRALPGVSLVQVIHVTGPDAVHEAVSIALYVNGILLDSGNQALPTKELGGTGRTHDWAMSRTIRESVDVPVFLAGGLTPGNIADAIRQVEPFGVDVCTGVRTNGRLDPEKLQSFFNNIAKA